MGHWTFTKILEILILTGIFYVILRFLRQTRGVGVIRGITVLLAGTLIVSYVLIRSFQLSRLDYAFQSLVEVTVIGLIIIFQPEIRRAITHVGENRFVGRLFGRLLKSRRESEVQKQVSSAAQNMARSRIGAIIAIEQVASLVPYVDRGTRLDATVDHLLLEAIFFPGNPLHDGAVVIQGDRVVGAGCVLPLSDNQDISRRLGTRHRAALGLSEQTDAQIVVVSEETGGISLFHEGRMFSDLKESELIARLGVAAEAMSAAGEGVTSG